MSLSKPLLLEHLQPITEAYDALHGTAYASFLTLPGPLWSRSSFPVHVTGSALPISRDGQLIAMVQHKNLERWLQPGGHLDEEEPPHRAAVRECFEETGLYLHLAADNPRPAIIDLHRIPANPRKGEPEHYHLDYRYVGFADGELALDPKESTDVRWVPVSAVLGRDPRNLKAVGAFLNRR